MLVRGMRAVWSSFSSIDSHAKSNRREEWKANCRNQACLLKNYFRAEITRKFVRKWLIVRCRNRGESHEITVLVPFSTATGDYTHVLLRDLRLGFLRMSHQYSSRASSSISVATLVAYSASAPSLRGPEIQ